MSSFDTLVQAVLEKYFDFFPTKIRDRKVLLKIIHPEFPYPLFVLKKKKEKMEDCPLYEKDFDAC